MEIDKMFTEPLMSIIDTGANMFLEYIQRVSSVKTFAKRSNTLVQKVWCILSTCPQDATSSTSKVAKDAESIRKSKAMLEDRNYVKVFFLWQLLQQDWSNNISGDAKWVWEMGQLSLPGE